MNKLTKVISSEFTKLKERLVTITASGKDTKTAREANAYGFDSSPIKGMVAVYSPTEVNGKTVIIGYVNQNQLAALGESRMYSTDANGALKAFIWLKADGKLQIGGTAKHMARFEELKSGFDQLKSDHNSLVNAFNTHMHATAGSGPPSTPTPGSGIPASTSTASIDPAKIDEITTL